MTTLEPPTRLSVQVSDNYLSSTFIRDYVRVAFGVDIGNDSYYFCNSSEFNRLLSNLNYEYVVSDFRIQDLAYNYDYDTSSNINENVEALAIIDRNTRIPSGYMIVRPWYPTSAHYDFWQMLATWPSSGDSSW